MEIPQIGLGTWQLRGESGRKSIGEALEIGYRHLDTADYYRNHDIVGKAIKNSGLKREEIYLVTKIMPLFTPQRIFEAGPRFLEELQTDYIDLLLVHWPDRNPLGEVLANFEKLKEDGITKKIGVSNFSLRKMEEIVSAGFEIYNHQIELYPGNFDEEMVSFCRENKISVTSYSPFAEGRLIHNVEIEKIAEKQGLSLPELILGWLLSKGVVVIPKASSRNHLEENFRATEVELSKETIKKLDNY